MTRTNGKKAALSILNVRPIDVWEWPKILVHIPLLPALPFADEVFPSLIEIARTGVRFIYHPFGSIDSTRNRVIEGFLQSPYTHLLFLDADHQHPPDIVQCMARWVLHDPTRLVVAGLYFNRREPFSPLAWVKGDDGLYYQIHQWDKGLIRGLDLVAAGCVLISREVFERIERPWFFHSYEGVAVQKEDFVYPTEDIGFFRKVREADIEIYLDTTISLPHARSGWVDENTYRSFCAMQEAQGKKEKYVKIARTITETAT